MNQKMSVKTSKKQACLAADVSRYRWVRCILSTRSKACQHRGRGHRVRFLYCYFYTRHVSRCVQGISSYHKLYNVQTLFTKVNELLQVNINYTKIQELNSVSSHTEGISIPLKCMTKQCLFPHYFLAKLSKNLRQDDRSMA